MQRRRRFSTVTFPDRKKLINNFVIDLYRTENIILLSIIKIVFILDENIEKKTKKNAKNNQTCYTVITVVYYLHNCKQLLFTIVIIRW